MEIIKPDRLIFGGSTEWKNQMAFLGPTTCKECVENHGKVFPYTTPLYAISLHPNCRCILVPMRTKQVGRVTSDKLNGADIYLMYLGKLPDNYVTKKEARRAKWKNSKGNLAEVLPGKMIGGDEYYNMDGKLPQAEGRTWYEADIDYERGYRNSSRILYSNDGLLFVTYDHYQTFYEITELGG